MMEEKLSKKLSVLVSKTTDQKLRILSKRNNRSVSQIIRILTNQWIDKVMNEGVKTIEK